MFSSISEQCWEEIVSFMGKYKIPYSMFSYPSAALH
jgi:hypothetical protein